MIRTILGIYGYVISIGCLAAMFAAPIWNIYAANYNLKLKEKQLR